MLLGTVTKGEWALWGAVILWVTVLGAERDEGARPVTLPTAGVEARPCRTGEGLCLRRPVQAREDAGASEALVEPEEVQPRFVWPEAIANR